MALHYLTAASLCFIQDEGGRTSTREGPPARSCCNTWFQLQSTGGFLPCRSAASPGAELTGGSCEATAACQPLHHTLWITSVSLSHQTPQPPQSSSQPAWSTSIKPNTTQSQELRQGDSGAANTQRQVGARPARSQTGWHLL